MADSKKAVKCESCGKFRKDEHVFEVGGEYDEYWTECYFCCSPSDRETYFKTDKVKEINVIKDLKTASTPTDFIIPIEQIKSGEFFTKQQLMDCVFTQCEKIDKLESLINETRDLLSEYLEDIRVCKFLDKLDKEIP